MFRRSYYIWHKNKFDDFITYYPYPFTWLDTIEGVAATLLKYSWIEFVGITEVVE